KQFFKDLEKEFDGTLASVKQLAGVCDEKFGDDAPTFRNLEATLQDVRQTVHSFLQRKRETDPDPPEETAGEEPDDAAAQPEAVSSGGAAAAPALAQRLVAAEPKSWQDAIAMVVTTAKSMRKQDPYNPAPFLMLRGMRWGELRGGGTKIDPRKLGAAPPDVRQ